MKRDQVGDAWGPYYRVLKYTSLRKDLQFSINSFFMCQHSYLPIYL